MESSLTAEMLNNHLKSLREKKVYACPDWELAHNAKVAESKTDLKANVTSYVTSGPDAVFLPQIFLQRDSTKNNAVIVSKVAVSVPNASSRSKKVAIAMPSYFGKTQGSVKTQEVLLEALRQTADSSSGRNQRSVTQSVMESELEDTTTEYETTVDSEEQSEEEEDTDEFDSEPPTPPWSPSPPTTPQLAQRPVSVHWKMLEEEAEEEEGESSTSYESSVEDEPEQPSNDEDEDEDEDEEGKEQQAAEDAAALVVEQNNSSSVLQGLMRKKLCCKVVKEKHRVETMRQANNPGVRVLQGFIRGSQVRRREGKKPGACCVIQGLMRGYDARYRTKKLHRDESWKQQAAKRRIQAGLAGALVRRLIPALRMTLFRLKQARREWKKEYIRSIRRRKSDAIVNKALLAKNDVYLELWRVEAATEKRLNALVAVLADKRESLVGRKYWYKWYEPCKVARVIRLFRTGKIELMTNMLRPSSAEKKSGMSDEMILAKKLELVKKTFDTKIDDPAAKVLLNLSERFSHANNSSHAVAPGQGSMRVAETAFLVQQFAGLKPCLTLKETIDRIEPIMQKWDLDGNGTMEFDELVTMLLCDDTFSTLLTGKSKTSLLLLVASEAPTVIRGKLLKGKASNQGEDFQSIVSPRNRGKQREAQQRLRKGGALLTRTKSFKLAEKLVSMGELSMDPAAS